MSHGITDEDRETLTELLEENRKCGGAYVPHNRTLMEVIDEETVIRPPHTRQSWQGKYHKLSGSHEEPQAACGCEAARPWVLIDRAVAIEHKEACSLCWPDGDPRATEGDDEQ